MTSRFLPVALLAGAILSACSAIQPARMSLPQSLAGSGDTVVITGVGGGRSGAWAAGPHSGEFRRSLDRISFFNTVGKSAGTTTFSVRGPEIDSAVDVSCFMAERTLTFGVVSFDPTPMSYHCEFTHDGRAIPARFEVQAAQSTLMKEERRGEIALDRVILQIRSVHRIEGSPLELTTPIGYAFEDNGRPVGAVEINGKPVITYAPGLDAAERRAVLAGSLALALFWDPAQVD